MELTPHLVTLESFGLISLAQADPDLEFLFRHALVQDTAYESMLKADRKLLHHSVATALESHYANRLAELAPTLAYHFARAENTEKARGYFILAGESALSNYANAEAEKHYRAALDLAPPDNERTELLTRLGDALSNQDMYDEAIQAWVEAVQIFQSLGDWEGVARMYTRMARAAGTAHGGDPERGLTLCREGLVLLKDQPESSALAALLHEAGRACFYNGLLDEARSYCQQAYTLAERLDDQKTQAETLATLWGLLPAASPTEAVEGLNRAARIAETSGYLDTAGRIYHNLGFRLGFEMGDMGRGSEYIYKAVDIWRKLGSGASQFYSLDVVLIFAILRGNLSEAEDINRKLYALLNFTGDPAQGAIGLEGWAAWIARCRGEFEGLVERFQALLEGFKRHQISLDTFANVECTFAELLLELGDLSQAAEIAWEAKTLADQGFMEPVEPNSLLVAIYVRQGRVTEALQLLTATKKNAPEPGVLGDIWLWLAEARLAVAEQGWRDAFAAFEQAATSLSRYGVRWVHAQTLCEWAEAHLTRNAPGDVDLASELFHKSLALFEEMNVPNYADLVRQRLQLLAA